MFYNTSMDPNQIRNLRRHLRESQAEFGLRFGVSPIAISYWESGRSRPNAENESKLAVTALSPTPSRRPPFRPIQYLGSKQRLCSSIAQVIDEVCPGNGRVGDLFSGSGVVSHFVGASRPVTAIDIQHYSATLCTALLKGQADSYRVLKSRQFSDAFERRLQAVVDCIAPLIEIEEDAIARAKTGDPTALVSIIEAGTVASHCQFPQSAVLSKLKQALETAELHLSREFAASCVTATRYYGGAYFSYRQAAALDALDMVARDYLPGALYCAQAVMLSAASEMVNTVGKQFAQPMKLQKRDGRVPDLLLKRTVKDRSLEAPGTILSWVDRWIHEALSSSLPHMVFQGDGMELLGKKLRCDVYYADPPYTIDHYSRFYHVLETLILRDDPKLAAVARNGTISPMRGLYRSERVQSSFSIPSQAPTAFQRMFAQIASERKPLVLSYSPFDAENEQRSRSVSLNDLVMLGKQYFRKVDIMSVSEHRHRKLNNRDRNVVSREDGERLIVLEV